MRAKRKEIPERLGEETSVISMSDIKKKAEKAQEKGKNTPKMITLTPLNLLYIDRIRDERRETYNQIFNTLVDHARENKTLEFLEPEEVRNARGIIAEYEKRKGSPIPR